MTILPQTHILIEGLNLTVSIGINEEERLKKQGTLFDLSLEVLPPSDGWSQADISQTVSYADIVTFIEDMTKDTHFDLVENLGARIIEAILENYPSVKGGAVKIIKPDILSQTQGVGCQMTFCR